MWWRHCAPYAPFCYYYFCTSTTTTTILRPLSGKSWISRYQKKHSPTHTYHDHQPSFISFLHLLRSLFNLLAWQSFCTTSQSSLITDLLVWHPPLYTPYISSDNHCLLFATHAHTFATCFAVVPRSCRLFLISQLYFWTSNYLWIMVLNRDSSWHS